MKSFLIPILSVALASFPGGLTAKPNVLLIYSDDHGWADLGIQGVDLDIRTPHLDQLARDGVLCKRGYVTAPQCVPSRAGVLTGRYQQRFGVEDNRMGPLPLEERTIAERLEAAGYISGWVGKSHLDLSGEKGGAKGGRLLPAHMPQHQGFQEYWRGELRQFHASHDLQGNPFADAPRVVTDPRFRVEVQTEAALSFLQRRRAQPEQPWFLYLAWYAPHVPLESPEPWFSQTPAHLPEKRRQALAMIAAMDHGLGQIRAKLKELGQEENTLIFFIGDNGAPLGKVWDGSINLPMTGQKGMVAEGGIRTPFVAAWPGHWPAGTVYDHPVSSLDVAATSVALAGLPGDPELDGVNLSPYFAGERSGAPHETLFWRWGSQAAVLEMPYKLIKIGNRPPLLFDLSTPEGEHIERNLAGKEPVVVQRLEGKLRQWVATLQPPGLDDSESAFNRHHQELFAEHGLTPAVGADRTQGWLARNGELAVRDGVLSITPDPKLTGKARPYLSRAGLSLPGPLTATLKIRSRSGGKGILSWRTKIASFEPQQSVAFSWPAGPEWGEVSLALREPGEIIHVRLIPAEEIVGAEIRAIELRDAAGRTVAFDFGTEP